MVLAIIVTYNGEKYIEDCLDSLQRQSYPIDILVVDNASKDNTCKIIQRRYPSVELFQVGYNSGFAHGNNLGMQYAIDRGYDYVMLINEDTIADSKLVEKMLQFANHETAVIPKIYMNGALTKVWYGAGKIDFKTYTAVNCQSEQSEMLTEVTFMTGCCMFIHTDILKKVGFFDESFFMYYEDTDLSLRLYENQIKMIYVPSTYVWHRIQGKISKPYYAYYMERNWLMLLKKHRKTFKCSCFRVVIKEWEKIVLNPDSYTVAFQRYKAKGIVDFIRNKIGMME